MATDPFIQIYIRTCFFSFFLSLFLFVVALAYPLCNFKPKYVVSFSQGNKCEEEGAGEGKEKPKRKFKKQHFHFLGDSVYPQTLGTH